MSRPVTSRVPRGAPGRPGPVPAREAREAVNVARDLVADGAARDEAARALAAVVPRRATLEAAHIMWVLDMHRGPSDDHEASAVLAVLLAALWVTPRPPA